MERVSFDFSTPAPTITIRDDGGDHQLVCGRDTWLKGISTYDENRPQKVAVHGTWTSADTYVARMALYETPFIASFHFSFDKDELHYQVKYNVSFGPTEYTALVGRTYP